MFFEDTSAVGQGCLLVGAALLVGILLVLF